MTVSAVENSNKGIKGKVWERKGTFIWQTGDGHAAQTLTLRNLIGALENVVVAITAVTGNPTVNVTLTGPEGEVLLSLEALADGTVHFKAYPTDFDSILLAGGDVTLSVDPSADAAGEAQTLTVEVVLRGLGD
jgi:hypothetical protein